MDSEEKLFKLLYNALPFLNDLSSDFGHLGSLRISIISSGTTKKIPEYINFLGKTVANKSSDDFERFQTIVFFKLGVLSVSELNNDKAIFSYSSISNGNNFSLTIFPNNKKIIFNDNSDIKILYEIFSHLIKPEGDIIREKIGTKNQEVISFGGLYNPKFFNELGKPI
jgi:hypothetical protein